VGNLSKNLLLRGELDTNSREKLESLSNVGHNESPVTRFNKCPGYFCVDLLDGYDNLDARLNYYLGELANALFWF
jgi:hypothetical protein